MKKENFVSGEKAEVILDGALDWESYDEICQANLKVGDIVTIEDYDESDHSVRVFESICSTWISAYHFKHI